MKLARIWEDWRAWRACRKADLHVQIPTPEPKLNTFETFLHLRPWQRIACIVACGVAYVACIQSTFSANVAPHFMAIWSDGRFNVFELVQTLTLSTLVVVLTASPLLLRFAPGASKIGVVIASLFIAYVTLDNACKVQEEGRETKLEAPRQKADRIARLDAEIESATKAYQQVPAHEYVLPTTVKAAETALTELKASAYDECHKGTFGMTRGAKCEGLEGKRDAKADEIEKFQRNADLTRRATDIEIELTRLKNERKDLGVVSENAGSILAGLPAFVADMGFPITGNVMAKHHPKIVAACAELVAWIFAPLSVASIFWLFSLLVCEKSEADRHMVKVLGSVAEERAKVALSVVPSASIQNWTGEEMQPDQSPAAVLEIEGDDPPAFVRNPQTKTEAVLAGVFRADPDKPKARRARTKKPAHRDSVLLFHKERMLDRPGRSVSSEVALDAYGAFCADRNLAPVPPQTFGRVMTELKIEKGKSGGKIKYLNIDLRPALRVVSG